MDLPTSSSSSSTTTCPSYVETDLKLVRFQGRPKDLSPKAFLLTKLLPWNEPPFDRHDWYVQKQPRTTTTTNTDNTSQQQQQFPTQRYVIDYYMIPSSHPDMPPTPHVDARPALDSPRAFLQRATQWFKEELPALAAEYFDWKAKQPRYYNGHGPYISKQTKTAGLTDQTTKNNMMTTKTKATS
jgi:Cytochrome c/c1 heme lyase